jgi:hypothetical protein
VLLLLFVYSAFLRRRYLDYEILGFVSKTADMALQNFLLPKLYIRARLAQPAKPQNPSNSRGMLLPPKEP